MLTLMTQQEKRQFRSIGINLNIAPQESIAGRFLRFHQKNPQVYNDLVTLARNARKHHRTVGIGTLYEVLRHDYIMQSPSGHRIELNNDYRSRYARLIMLLEKDLKGYFTVRGLQTK